MRSRNRRIWPGLYLKSGIWNHVLDEAHAVCYVKRHAPAIPTPVLYDCVIFAPPEIPVDMGYILTSELPGSTLDLVMDDISPENLFQIGEDLRTCLKSVRQIPNPHTISICSASGGNIHAPYFYGDDIPSQLDVAALHGWFKKTLGPRYYESLRWKMAPVLERTNYTIRFCHADLAARNILVHKGRLSGLLDWAEAAWMPAYWEYACALHSGNFVHGRFKSFIIDVLSEDYELEREVLVALAEVYYGTPPDELFGGERAGPIGDGGS